MFSLSLKQASKISSKEQTAKFSFSGRIRIFLRDLRLQPGLQYEVVNLGFYPASLFFGS
jgi:hypothetical protein